MSDIETSSLRRRLKLGAAAIALLVIGGGAGAFAGHAFHPAIAMAPIHATAIKGLTDGSGIVTVKGRVAERYGNQFVLDDGTGKTLIDAGPAGEDSSLAPAGSIVSVQGRFEHGGLRPSFLVDPAGKVIEVGHRGPGRHDHRGHGPRDLAGDDGDGPDRAPPPPAPGAAPQPTTPSVPNTKQ
ncbi:hypothetical protein [Sphingomonas immobilis]|uniref:Bacterial OB-fold domain-containing protein n=1 Tax=Sphingomonas immobilis TaxID=3063997 RepID=A0ABT9A0Q5_9SPHN|nr:hypothetical protein [Sphingomonas sp. CA1-15]MDO7843419.1 hypothetical protein [Sphingomonas sp. CA1-15]